MADKKISQLTNLTGANLAENDEFVLVDTSADETKAITFGELKTAFDTGTGFVRVTGDTMTGGLTVPTVDINGGTIDGTVIGGTTPAAGSFTTGSFTGDVSFGNNDKAIFGAGSDLQIYSDGNTSFIKEGGAGNFAIDGTNIFIRNGAGSANMASFVDGGAASLYHNSTARLATTSTGVDVTGTLTSDGLTVDGGAANQVATFSSTDAGAFLYIQDNNALGYYHGSSGGSYVIRDTDNKNRINIGSGGDISFYEDTGTTPKFFWDASAESLGIGTSSPSDKLHLLGSGETGIRIDDSGTARYAEVTFGTTNGAMVIGSQGGSPYPITFQTGGTEAMRIDSSGNVGIGTSSPSTPLHVNGAGTISGITYSTAFVNTSNGTSYFTDASTGNGIYVGGSTGSPANTVRLFTNASEAMRIDASGNVGIGTSNPAYQLEVGDGLDASETINLKSSNTGSTSIFFSDAASNGQGRLTYTHSDNILKIYTADAERMRIDSSGNLLVGKTSANTATVGVEALSNGEMNATVNGGRVISLDRLGSDGDIIRLRRSSSTVGSIGVNVSGSLYINGTGNGYTEFRSDETTICALYSGGFYPTPDNSRDLGQISYRWDDIYATNGTIQTSDRNEKQDIEVLSDAETRVAQACKGLLRKFRWKDAVAEKGDDARIHFGIIAQDLQDAFAAEGLDAGRYAMFISSTWWETQTDVPAVAAVEAVEATYDEDGNELTPAVEAVEAKEAYTRTDTYETLEEAPEGATERTRLGVRYPELLAFIIAAI